MSKFTAVLKNYQDNTILTMQLQNTSDQSNIPVTFICENGTYTVLLITDNTDTYNTTACIDTDGSKQTVNLSEYETLSVLGLTDWKPHVEITGNSFDTLSRTNSGYLYISCQQPAFVSNITDAEFQVVYTIRCCIHVVCQTMIWNRCQKYMGKAIFHTTLKLQKTAMPKIIS